MGEKKKRFETRVIHEAQSPGDWNGATLPPIYQSAAHRYETAEGLSDVFAGKEKGFIYMRLRNPTNQVLERKVAAACGIEAAGFWREINEVLVRHFDR